MSNLYKVACIGTGFMGSALIRGIAKKIDVKNLFITDFSLEKAKKIADSINCVCEKSNRKVVEKADIIFLAVKPPTIQSVIEDIADLLSSKIIISVAAGISLEAMYQFYEEGLRKQNISSFNASLPIVRLMPNLPVIIGEGMIGLCHRNVDTKIISTIVTLLEATGRIEIVDEKLMDVVTAVSGSGPAYVALFVEAMADAAVKLGMTRDKAYIYACQTLKGSATYLLNTEQHPGILKDAVCSPSGTTIAAIEALEKTGFRSSLMSGITASYNRSVELGQ